MVAGTNILRVSLQGVADGTPCGVHVQARVSRFDFHYASPRLPNDATEADLNFAALPAGSVVVAHMGSTNRAGLASTASSNLIMIDDTPPTHPEVQGCTPGGFFSHVVPSHEANNPPGYYYYQSTTHGLQLCWPPQASFSDHESGFWTLQWQVARWVADIGVWDTITPTQTMHPNLGQEVANGGVLNLTSQALQSISVFATLRHNEQYRLGLRAMNRAGVVSCGPEVERCRKLALRHGHDTSKCVCPDATGQTDNWAATQLASSVPFMIDLEPPSCNSASAWLCDPRVPMVSSC